MADIDNFKKVNDLFGHRIGDEILKMFARVLLDNVRADDTVARYGGEEFAVILPEARVEHARQVTERMRSQLEAMQLAINDSGQEIGRHHGTPSASPSSERATMPMRCCVAPMPSSTRPSVLAGTALPSTKRWHPEQDRFRLNHFA